MEPRIEQELLARCRSGEAAAWDALFDAYYAVVAKFVFQLASDFTREDAEEVSQDAFLAVINHLDSFKGGSRFQTWLFRIAANKAQDYRDKRRAAKRGGGVNGISLDAENPQTGTVLDLPGNQPAPDAALLNTERFSNIRNTVDRLDPPCREVIELRYFGDLSYEEISAALEINVKTVSSRLSKCLDKLETLIRPILEGERHADSVQ